MKKIAAYLEDAYARYHHPRYLESDPLEYLHRFQDPKDQEVIGVFAALMAYGNVKQIRGSVEKFLGRIEKTGLTPKEWILVADEFPLFWKGFVHRFNDARDWELLSGWLSLSHQRYGSLAAHFAFVASRDQVALSEAFGRVAEEWRLSAGKEAQRSSVKHLLSSPGTGGTCKRWWMFLRWMIRQDRLDPGPWQKLLPPGAKRRFLPDELFMPLDVHTGRLSQSLGLTHRRSLNWKAVVEVTDALKTIDPTDPVRYDFSLCRIGMFSNGR